MNHSLCHCFSLKIWLFERQNLHRGERHREKESHRDKETFHCWFIPPVGTVARAGLGNSQEPGTLFGSPICVTGGQSLLLSESWIKNGAARAWDASVTGNVLTRALQHWPPVPRCLTETSNGKISCSGYHTYQAASLEQLVDSWFIWEKNLYNHKDQMN